MNDETKKEDYYREEWAKIQVEKHNAQKNAWGGVLLALIFYIIPAAFHSCGR